MNGIIRPASPDEKQLLSELIRKSFKDVAVKFNLTPANCPTHPSNCTPDWVEAAIQKGIQYFILEKEGVPCGCVAIEVVDSNRCYLERLAVLPEYRRTGFGEQLVRYIFKEAKAREIKQVEISIIAEYTSLRRWYEKLGFIAFKDQTFPNLPFGVTFMRKQFDV